MLNIMVLKYTTLLVYLIVSVYLILIRLNLYCFYIYILFSYFIIFISLIKGSFDLIEV
jgi:hypothetical protein